MAVPEGDATIPVIQALVDEKSLWDGLYTSKDWHPAEHMSFHTNHDDATPFTLKRIHRLNLDQVRRVKLKAQCSRFSSKLPSNSNEQMMWNPHCVQNTSGADITTDLKLPKETVVILKGTHPDVDSYSAFGDGFDKTMEKTELEDKLKDAKIDHLFVVGLALDYCVAFTAMDAAKAGLHATVILPACRGIAPETIEDAKSKMKDLGVDLLA